jgi:hypothetical protein
MSIDKGIAKVLLGKRDVKSDVVPIDYVVDTIMCAAWHITLYPDDKVKVYNCTSNARPVKYGIDNCYRIFSTNVIQLLGYSKSCD